MKKYIYICTLLFVLGACKSEEQPLQQKENATAVTDQGTKITFTDVEKAAFFKTETVDTLNQKANFRAPAKIAASVIRSSQGVNQNLILFENPELASHYTQLMQHQINIRQIQNINIKQKKLELSRTKDLLDHGAVSGQELLNAQTELSMEESNLANEKASLVEHESKLIAGGFTPDLLRNAKAGMAYLIADIPENQISKITIGGTCAIEFNSFPEEKFVGKIDAIADVVDHQTRMIKVRIAVNNSSTKLKAGMFANVSFELSKGNFISVHNSSMVTVQGKHYVFVKKSDKEFERKEINTGQQIGERTIVFDGLNVGDQVATEGVMQLKGLSFGY